MQDDERMDKPSTPLKPKGKPGPPTILDVQQKYTAVEGIVIDSYFIMFERCSLS